MMRCKNSESRACRSAVRFLNNSPRKLTGLKSFVKNPVKLALNIKQKYTRQQYFAAKTIIDDIDA
jgi:hypothetical protein